MSVFSDYAEDLADVFDVDAGMAIDITYVSAEGAPVSCTGIVSYGEDLDDAQWRAALQATANLNVLKSDVPSWSSTDTVLCDGGTWNVVKKLGETPADWKLEIRRDLRPTFRGR